MGKLSGRSNKFSLAVFAVSLLLTTVLLVTWGEVAHWDTGEALGVAGLAVSIAGFSLAIWQLQRTRDAATAALAAIQETLKGVAASRLATVIVEMRWDLQEFERSIDGEPDYERAKAALTRWREHGGDAETLIHRRFGGDADCLPSLQKSREIARATKAGMFGAGDAEPDLQKCLELMEHSVDALGPLLEQLWPTDNEKE